MNASDPLNLYTDASTKDIGGVLMQVQGGKEKPCVFVSYRLSDQATRWGVMELELFGFSSASRILLLTFLVNFLQ